MVPPDSSDLRQAALDEPGFLVAMTDLAGALAVAQTEAEISAVLLDAVPAALGADLIVLGTLEEGRARFARSGGPADGVADRARSAEALLAACLERPEHTSDAFSVSSPDGSGTIVTAPAFGPDGDVLGAVAVQWAVSSDLDATTRARLAMVARFAGAALGRARRTGAHREVVHQIQRELLPSPRSTDDLAVTTLYLPATVDLGFGGDWYDLITLDPDRHVALVGDVVGHGTGAAARMTQVRGALAALVHRDVDLPELVARATEVLQRMTSERDYIATAALVMLEPRRERVTAITAGHPPPLVRLPDGEVCTLDGARSTPLGFRCSVPDAQVASFPPGSTLLAYTDGLVERRDEPITVGIERLHCALAGQEPLARGHELDELVALVLPGSAQRRDDVAVLAVHHRDPSRGQ